MPNDDPGDLIVDHLAGLREAIAWLDEHPAFAALVTHTRIGAAVDNPAMFAAALRQLGPDAVRVGTLQSSTAEARLTFAGATRIWASIPTGRLPRVPTGRQLPEYAIGWPK
jgi:hypothetical protein